MVVSNPKEIILQWRDFYQMKKVENKVFLVAVVLRLFRFCLLVLLFVWFETGHRHTHGVTSLKDKAHFYGWEVRNRHVYLKIHKTTENSSLLYTKNHFP